MRRRAVKTTMENQARGKEKKDGERERDAKDAEGSTPSEGVTYASIAAEGGIKSRSWVEEVNRTEEGEGEGVMGMKENERSRMAEVREIERDETWQWEMRERRIRARNLGIRGMEGEKGEVEQRVESWLEKELGKKVEVEQIWITKENLVIVRLRRMEDFREIVERRDEIWERWELWVERDRTFRERRNRWLVNNRARKARREGKEVTEEEERVCIDGTWWMWREEVGDWHKHEVREMKENETQAAEGVECRRAVKTREEVVSWRKDLERRKEEIRKEEKELAAEEARVRIATTTAENTGEGVVQEDAEKGRIAEEKDKKTEEKPKTAVEKDRKTQKKVKEAGKNKGKREEREAGSERERIETETATREKQKSGNKYSRKEKEIATTSDKETQHKSEGGRTERRTQEVEKWREDLERRKSEIRKEEEELEEEERKIQDTER